MNNERLFWLGVIGFLLWYCRGTSSVTLKQTCQYPDGTTVLVELGAPCPYDPAHGGQSIVITGV